MVDAVPPLRDLAITTRPIEALIPYPNNPRTHSPEQVALLVRSLREFGWTNPVLVDEAGGVIAGHGRLLAARELGMAEVPCIELAGLSEAQRRAYVIADNKLAEAAGWDRELLKVELGALQGADFELSLTGFLPVEIKGYLDEPLFEPVGEDEQGRLDQRSPVKCPECGNEFAP